MTVGVDAAQGQMIANSLESSGSVVLQAPNVQEATMVIEFVEESIDLLVIDSATIPPSAQRRIHSIVATRWPQVKALVLASSGEQGLGIAEATLLSYPYELQDVVTTAVALLGSQDEGAQAAEKRSTAVPR